MMKQYGKGALHIHTRKEMVDLVVADGHARGIVARDLISGEITSHEADVVVLATGGYSNVYYLSTNAMTSNCSAIWRAYRKGAWLANPSFAQIHPTCVPRTGRHQSKLTLMSESLRNDGRVWVPDQAGDKRPPEQIPEAERDYYLERIYPSFGNLVPRDVASRNAKAQCDAGKGVGGNGQAVYLDFREALERLGHQVVEEKYGNIFDMYRQITDENPYETPMKIYPAAHYTMGGLWVDYDLMSNIPGLFVLGEANFSDHGANRLGASALMQGLADGYFIAPYTIQNYLVEHHHDQFSSAQTSFRDDTQAAEHRYQSFISNRGENLSEQFHHQLGSVMWNHVGMERSAPGLRQAIADLQQLATDFQGQVRVPGRTNDLNEQLEKAARIEDFIALGELMARDALNREESCGAHFRVEYQTEEHEARRNDEQFACVSVWQNQEATVPLNLQEPLVFRAVTPQTRSYT
ncbi:MAG: succinate dehydrogenase (quinone) flavoprotein subunit [Pseudomonadales bacterium]|nr:succinate dehydrogenase (quinone) flavoprotein subunit [Pseudomonadales bacterium]